MTSTISLVASPLEYIGHESPAIAVVRVDARICLNLSVRRSSLTSL